MPFWTRKLSAIQTARVHCSISIYRKPTHTDQYLHFDSHHPISHKLSVIRTLFHRADVAVTDPKEKEKELKHVKSALAHCGYRNWTFDLARKNKKQSNSADTASAANNQPAQAKSSTFILLPYIDGLSQKLQRIFKTYGVSTCFKPHNTLRKLLVSPKDPTPNERKAGVVYEIPCEECPKTYIGQTVRQLSERLKEHKSTAPSRKPSAVAEHKLDSQHKIAWEATKVLDKDSREYPLQVREAIQIKKKSPELNRDQGLELPALYSPLLIRPKVNKVVNSPS